MKNELYLFLPLFQNTISIHFQMFFFSISKLTCKKVNFESLTENSEHDHERWLHDESKRKTFKVAHCEFQLLYT